MIGVPVANDVAEALKATHAASTSEVRVPQGKHQRKPEFRGKEVTIQGVMRDLGCVEKQGEWLHVIQEGAPIGSYPFGSRGKYTMSQPLLLVWCSLLRQPEDLHLLPPSGSEIPESFGEVEIFNGADVSMWRERMLTRIDQELKSIASSTKSGPPKKGTGIVKAKPRNAGSSSGGPVYLGNSHRGRHNR